jgi:hypothetical protein
MVLELDLYHLTLQQISEFVRSKCSQYGTVFSVSVKLFPISSDRGRSFAIIEMASPEENTKLRETIGDGYADQGVVVNLLHNPKGGHRPWSCVSPDFETAFLESWCAIMRRTARDANCHSAFSRFLLYPDHHCIIDHRIAQVSQQFEGFRACGHFHRREGEVIVGAILYDDDGWHGTELRTAFGNDSFQFFSGQTSQV